MLISIFRHDNLINTYVDKFVLLSFNKKKYSILVIDIVELDKYKSYQTNWIDYKTFEYIMKNKKINSILVCFIYKNM